MKLSQAQKQPRLQDFLNQDENKSKFNFPNANHETKKQEQGHNTFKT
jgi:hypothetical protein